MTCGVYVYTCAAEHSFGFSLRPVHCTQTHMHVHTRCVYVYTTNRCACVKCVWIYTTTHCGVYRRQRGYVRRAVCGACGGKGSCDASLASSSSSCTIVVFVVRRAQPNGLGGILKLANHSRIRIVSKHVVAHSARCSTLCTKKCVQDFRV